MRECREKSGPFSRLGELPDLAADEITLERGDVADVEPAVQMIGLVQESAGEEIFAGLLEGFTLDVLSPNRHAFGARDLFPEGRDAEAAFLPLLLAFDVDDLRVNEDDLLGGVLGH